MVLSLLLLCEIQKHLELSLFMWCKLFNMGVVSDYNLNWNCHTYLMSFHTNNWDWDLGSLEKVRGFGSDGGFGKGNWKGLGFRVGLWRTRVGYGSSNQIWRFSWYRRWRIWIGIDGLVDFERLRVTRGAGVDDFAIESPSDTNWRRCVENQPWIGIDQRKKHLQDKIISAETLTKGTTPRRINQPMIILLNKRPRYNEEPTPIYLFRLGDSFLG